MSDPETDARRHMVETQIAARGISDPVVLAAMRRVPRHLFVPPPDRPYAYADGPLGIGRGQTISQPYIVALMTELIRPYPSMRVLEIGAGSGYQTAVLAECVAEVHAVEILPALAQRTRALLEELGYHNFRLRVGDGNEGWPERAPFDAVLVAAAPQHVPERLLEQLEPGGRLVIPVGTDQQQLVRITRTPEGFHRETITPVRFVPLIQG